MCGGVFDNPHTCFALSCYGIGENSHYDGVMKKKVDKNFSNRRVRAMLNLT